MALLGTFDTEQQAIVAANGTATVTFTCPLNQQWIAKQVSIEMLTAPVGAAVTLRKLGALIAPGFSARKTAFGGDPPVPIRAGESISVVWTGCTPGEIGKAYMLYEVTSTY